MGCEPKFHLVNMKTICSSVPRGGLEVKNLMFNKALVCKWIWLHVQEETPLWRKVIDGKYGVQRGGWCLKETQGPYSVSLDEYQK
jgi:hypothetical protein